MILKYFDIFNYAIVLPKSVAYDKYNAYNLRMATILLEKGIFDNDAVNRDVVLFRTKRIIT